MSLRVTLPRYNYARDFTYQNIAKYPNSLLASVIEQNPTTTELPLTLEFITPAALDLVYSLVELDEIPPQLPRETDWTQIAKYFGIPVLLVMANPLYDQLTLRRRYLLDREQLRRPGPYRNAMSFAVVNKYDELLSYVLDVTPLAPISDWLTNPGHPDYDIFQMDQNLLGIAVLMNNRNAMNTLLLKRPLNPLVISLDRDNLPGYGVDIPKDWKGINLILPEKKERQFRGAPQKQGEIFKYALMADLDVFRDLISSVGQAPDLSDVVYLAAQPEFERYDIINEIYANPKIPIPSPHQRMQHIYGIYPVTNFIEAPLPIEVVDTILNRLFADPEHSHRLWADYLRAWDGAYRSENIPQLNQMMPLVFHILSRFAIANPHSEISALYQVISAVTQGDVTLVRTLYPLLAKNLQVGEDTEFSNNLDVITPLLAEISIQFNKVDVLHTLKTLYEQIVVTKGVPVHVPERVPGQEWDVEVDAFEAGLYANSLYDIARFVNNPDILAELERPEWRITHEFQA